MFKTIKSSLFDYSDAYILAKGPISVAKTAAADADANNENIKGKFKNCAAFTDCKVKKNNPQVGNAKNTDVVMPIYNLIEYNDNYSKRSGILWSYCKNKPTKFY